MSARTLALLLGAARVVRFCPICERQRSFRRGDEHVVCASCRVAFRLDRAAMLRALKPLREAHAAVYGGRVAR